MRAATHGVVLGMLLALGSCRGATMEPGGVAVAAPPAKVAQAVAKPPRDPKEPVRMARERRTMVETQLQRRDIRDEVVLAAMDRVPRHRFVPSESLGQAYGDHPLPIGHRQTISQPYIVALMTQMAGVKPPMKVLDVGTGSGYQAAVLAEIVDHVYGIEIVCPLATRASGLLKELGYENVTVRCGDGYKGWPEHAPFDAIILAAAPDHVPQPLVDQLAPGGRLVLPVGSWHQELVVMEKGEDGKVVRRPGIGVRFVPMTGPSAERRPR